ncbi:alpha/beta hydrolase-fold protein [Phenylobacterium sp.]|uniref:alpha/beta hydrolase n=1 Tax=Phenylobacterium sp. TaxID=1871053 RepID=UPI00301D4CFE
MDEAAGWSRATAPPGQMMRRLTGADGQGYRLLLATPPQASPASGHPAVLVLDADLHFQIVAGAAAALSRRTEKTRVPPLAVIGLAPDDDGARRIRDFTDGPPDPPAATPHPAGGAETLLALIEDQILPAVAAVAAMDRARLGLFGHSLGALFGLYAMTRRPGLFAAYALVSPSLWWRPALADQAVDAARGRVRALHLAWGELEAGGEAGDAAGRAMGPRAARALASFAVALGPDAVSGGAIQDEDHGSAPVAACPAALRALSRGFAA